jgi:ATPase subunit of ABC transporter with duplicated ATPase domains
LSSGLAVSNLAYAHPGGDLLFDGVSFRLVPGRHAGLIGTNGVGKSTLMRILVLLLDEPTDNLDIDSSEALAV